MSAPRRWIEDGGGATPFERDLLRSAVAVEPPPDAQKHVWAAVLAQVPAAAVAAGAAGTGAAAAKAAAAAKGTGAAVAAAVKGGAGAGGAALATTATAGILQSVIIGAGAAVAVLATYSVVAPPDKAAPVSPPAVVAPAPAAPRIRMPVGGGLGVSPIETGGPSREEAAQEPAPAPTPAPSAAATPERERRPADPRPAAVPGSSAAPIAPATGEAAPGPVGEVERETMIREEARLVGEARGALQGGDAAGALTRLDQIRARFPGGTLGQEVEVLTIEALARSGRRAEASTRAGAFLQAHPTSALAGRVQPFVR